MTLTYCLVLCRALQARVSRQVMMNKDEDDSDDEPKQPERISLADLKHRGKKKATAPINRAGPAIKSNHIYIPKKSVALSKSWYKQFSSSLFVPSLSFKRGFWWVLQTGFTGGLQSRGAPALGNASNSRLVIFDENKVQSVGPSEPRLESWMAPPSSRAKENEQKPERWCDVKVWGKKEVLC